jgi:hypothetical protein
LGRFEYDWRGNHRNSRTFGHTVWSSDEHRHAGIRGSDRSRRNQRQRTGVNECQPIGGIRNDGVKAAPPPSQNDDQFDQLNKLDRQLQPNERIE